MRSIRALATPLILLLLGASTPALAQQAGTLQATKAEIRESRRDRRDARKDLKRLERIVRSWDKAVETRNLKKAQKADADLFAWIQEERQETRGEIREARKEVRGSKAEVRRSRQTRDRARGGAVRDARVDLRADRRDLEDDRKDLATETFRRDKIGEIASELRAIQPAFRGQIPRAPKIERKRTLLKQLYVTAKRDLAQAEEELAEDKAEKVEDKARKRKR